MRIVPFLGFVKSREDVELASFLQLDPDREWSILVFEWLNYTYAFYAYAKRVSSDS